MMLVLSFIVFFLMHRAVEGNIVDTLAGPSTSQQVKHQMATNLGLYKPILVQYGIWLGHAVRGDLGVSYITGLDVTSTISQEIPVSFELAILSMLLATLVGVPLGLLAGLRNGSKTDLAVRIPFLLMYAVPVMIWGGFLLLGAALYWRTFYAMTYVPFLDDPVSNLRSILLPAVAVALAVASATVQLTRATTIDVLAQPHIMTARAVGLTRLRRIGIYTLKAASVPVITMQGFVFGGLLGGLIIVEAMFSLPGLGGGLLTAINTRDYNLIQAQVVVLALAFTIGNLLADIAAAAIDKRITNG